MSHRPFIAHPVHKSQSLAQRTNQASAFGVGVVVVGVVEVGAADDAEDMTVQRAPVMADVAAAPRRACRLACLYLCVQIKREACSVGVREELTERSGVGRAYAGQTNMGLTRRRSGKSCVRLCFSALGAARSG